LLRKESEKDDLNASSAHTHTHTHTGSGRRWKKEVIQIFSEAIFVFREELFVV